MKKNVIDIVKEDLLEALGRENKQTPIREIEPEINVPQSVIDKGIEELKREGFIRVDGDLLSLTDRGLEQASTVIEKHSVLQDYFAENRNEKEARKAASILEHYVSLEVLDSLKKLSTLKKGTPLTEFTGSEGVITDIVFERGLFERVVSMGIFPGKKVIISEKISNGLIVELENKKFALAAELAKGIKVAASGRS